jgi:hypothetical protein
VSGFWSKPRGEINYEVRLHYLVVRFFIIYKPALFSGGEYDVLMWCNQIVSSLQEAIEGRSLL